MIQVQENGTLVRKEELAPGIWRLTLAAADIAKVARPGQFVMVRIGQDYDPLLRRPLSIHQATSDGMVQLLLKVVGKGTARLAEVTLGRTLSLLGPLGQGFTPSRSVPVCLVGGGMGIAPLYFLLKELLRPGSNPPPVVILGARNRLELSRLAEDFRALGPSQLFLATDDGSMGYHGLVTDLLALECAGLRELQVCTCGPLPMMKALAGICRDRGWSCQVSLETMMACGFGVCLGCAIPSSQPEGEYLHVCKDGPVFDVDRLGW